MAQFLPLVLSKRPNNADYALCFCDTHTDGASDQLKKTGCVIRTNNVVDGNRAQYFGTSISLERCRQEGRKIKMKVAS